MCGVLYTAKPLGINWQTKQMQIACKGGKKMVRCREVGDIALTMCCKLNVRRHFSSLSREMLTFSRLIQHKSERLAWPIYMLS